MTDRLTERDGDVRRPDSAGALNASLRWGFPIATLACLTLGGWLYSQFPQHIELGGVLLRVGALLAALWLALPLLNRPMQWLPPGLLGLLLCLGLVAAARPRLLLLAVPIAGVLIGLGTAARFFRVIQDSSPPHRDDSSRR
jgi:hypothetical protein